ncbi:TetR/AcrR family transcriptional regulator C-terminal domain-containing protein [Mycobacterium sp. PDNC021]|uniref:TetR/AcrR family transcriptional regulator C-terminal domain-containing protein n=1 Tax=Mycobacterium sp. PDNC021 TaxID=3391399 RepID=UPI003AACE463
MAKIATTEKRPRRERGSINPDDIVNGAFELAEQVSIDNLSMPMLGKYLDVGVTSIYWYFRKKDDLLDAMTDRALRQCVLAATHVESKDWRSTLRNHARTMRETFVGNPILCDLILIRSAQSPHIDRSDLQAVEKAIASLVDAGLSTGSALSVYSAVSAHVRGSAVLQRLRDKTAANDKARGRQHELAINPETTPLLAQAVQEGQHVGTADEQNFDFGLECILDHAERLIELNRKSAPRARKAPRP